jgi:short subunit dehydrogenase-like uncharacterized protein
MEYKYTPCCMNRIPVGMRIEVKQCYSCGTLYCSMCGAYSMCKNCNSYYHDKPDPDGESQVVEVVYG